MTDATVAPARPRILLNAVQTRTCSTSHARSLRQHRNVGAATCASPLTTGTARKLPAAAGGSSHCGAGSFGKAGVKVRYAGLRPPLTPAQSWRTHENPRIPIFAPCRLDDVRQNLQDLRAGKLPAGETPPGSPSADRRSPGTRPSSGRPDWSLQRPSSTPPAPYRCSGGPGLAQQRPGPGSDLVGGVVLGDDRRGDPTPVAQILMAVLPGPLAYGLQALTVGGRPVRRRGAGAVVRGAAAPP